MDTLKKVLAYIFSTLFIVTAVLALILFTFDRRAFRAETYQHVFANEDFYNQIPLLLAKTITSTDLNNLPLTMQGMSEQAWEAFFRKLLPQESLAAIGNDALTSTFAYLNMQTNSAQISLLPIKTNMLSDTGVQAVYELLNSQPDCTITQIGQMTLNLLTDQQIQFCKPPDSMQPILTPLIQTQLQTAALVIPDQITIASSDGVAPENDPRVKVRDIRIGMRLSPLLPIGFLFLLSIVAVNSLTSWLDWWGIPLLITGILTFLIGVSGAPIFGVILRFIISRKTPAFLPSIFSQYASDLAATMIQVVTKPIVWEGLFLFFVGLGMVGVSVYLKNKRAK